MSKTPKKLPPGVRLMDSGRYQARYPVTENGVTRQVSAGTFATTRDAADARSRQMMLVRTGAWVDPVGARKTVAQWSKEWLELSRGGNRGSRSFIRSRIVPYWGAVPLGDITPIMVKRWINSLVEEGLSPATVQGLYKCFKQLMTHAVEYDLLVKSPCRLIDNVPSSQPTRVDPLPIEKLLELEMKAPVRYAALIHLAINTGMRWGELAALQWDAVDLERGLIHVFRGVKADGLQVGDTKNGKDRWVKLDPLAVEMLRSHRRDFYAGHFVFTTATHKVRLRYSEFRRSVWLPLVEQCELDITFHALRHSHAGHMVMAGVDWKVLADRLGHHAPSLTMDLYGWVRPDKDDVIVAAIEAARQPKVAGN